MSKTEGATEPVGADEIIAALRRMDEGDALDLLHDVAREIGYWPALLNRLGLLLLKPDAPQGGEREA